MYRPNHFEGSSGRGTAANDHSVSGRRIGNRPSWPLRDLRSISQVDSRGQSTLCTADCRPVAVLNMLREKFRCARSPTRDHERGCVICVITVASGGSKPPTQDQWLVRGSNLDLLSKYSSQASVSLLAKRAAPINCVVRQAPPFTAAR